MQVGNTEKFEMIAKMYDTPERTEMARISADAIREYIVDAKSKKAADVGCGTGLVGLNLLNEFHSMLFLDASPNMINQIKQKTSDLHIQHAHTLCVDIEKDRLPDLCMDVIFMAQVLLHIHDVEFVLSKLFDALNEGGHLLIVDFNKNENVVSNVVHNGFSQADLKDTMTKIGYKDIESNTFFTGKKLFMGHDASMFVLSASK